MRRMWFSASFVPCSSLTKKQAVLLSLWGLDVCHTCSWSTALPEGVPGFDHPITLCLKLRKSTLLDNHFFSPIFTTIILQKWHHQTLCVFSYDSLTALHNLAVDRTSVLAGGVAKCEACVTHSSLDPRNFFLEDVGAF